MCVLITKAARRWSTFCCWWGQGQCLGVHQSPNPLECETPFVSGGVGPGSAIGTFLFTLLSILLSTYMYIVHHMQFQVRPGQRLGIFRMHPPNRSTSVLETFFQTGFQFNKFFKHASRCRWSTVFCWPCHWPLAKAGATR